MKTTKIKSLTEKLLDQTNDSTVLNIENHHALDIFGINNENLDFIDENLKVAIITPDKDIVKNAETLNPAYIVFQNYEIILKWNRSLRFALAVCTLKNKFKDDF